MAFSICTASTSRNWRPVLVFDAGLKMPAANATWSIDKVACEAPVGPPQLYPFGSRTLVTQKLHRLALPRPAERPEEEVIEPLVASYRKRDFVAVQRSFNVYGKGPLQLHLQTVVVVHGGRHSSGHHVIVQAPLCCFRIAPSGPRRGVLGASGGRSCHRDDCWLSKTAAGGRTGR